MTNYFNQPCYLKIDNKPLLFVYDAHKLATDLGGVTNVASAFEQMREACRRAGFDGLYLLAEYRGLDAARTAIQEGYGLRLHLRLHLAHLQTGASHPHAA